GNACGIATDARAYCWGDNEWGQAGDGTRDVAYDSIMSPKRNSPRSVVGGLQFSSIYAGHMQRCALTSDGSAYCWGGDYGVAPTRVESGTVRFASLAVRRHICGLDASGTAYCWGTNDYGELGD